MSVSLQVVPEVALDDGRLSRNENVVYSEDERRIFGTTLSKLGIGIAVSADTIEEVTDLFDKDRDYFSSFVRELSELQETTIEISSNIKETTAVASEANVLIQDSRANVTSAREEISRLIEAVQASETRMEELSTAIENVGGIINVINTIAKQTNLLALNATIEAARAGEAGKGFSVVANEVKALASSTSAATTQIEDTLDEIKGGFDLLKITSKETRSTADSVGEKTGVFGTILDSVSEAMDDIDRRTGIIDQQMGVVNETCEEFVTISSNVANNLETSGIKLTESTGRMREVADSSDNLVLQTVKNGRNPKEEMIVRQAEYAALKSIEIIQSGLGSGQVSMSELFDRDHQEVSGSNPAQHIAKYSNFIDQHIQPLIEEVVASNERIAWCAVIDDTAYLTANILAVSQPQGDDPIWNMANCRNHRYFFDRTGKRAGLNQEPLLLQTYRRDMGNGVFVPMKDISAPIIINGRHWGGFRVGYTPE